MESPLKIRWPKILLGVLCGIVFFSLGLILFTLVKVMQYNMGLIDIHPDPKISRIKADLRSLATALESYYQDHAAYPAWSDNPQDNAFAMELERNESLTPKQIIVPSFRMSSPRSPMASLTTPVSYLTNLFADVSSPYSEDASFAYWTVNEPTEDGAAGWIIWAAGADLDYDITRGNVAQVYPGPSQAPTDLMIDLTYDPTNGTRSSGDVYRYKRLEAKTETEDEAVESNKN